MEHKTSWYCLLFQFMSLFWMGLLFNEATCLSIDFVFESCLILIPDLQEKDRNHLQYCFYRSPNLRSSFFFPLPLAFVHNLNPSWTLLAMQTSRLCQWQTLHLLTALNHRILPYLPLLVLKRQRRRSRKSQLKGKSHWHNCMKFPLLCALIVARRRHLYGGERPMARQFVMRAVCISRRGTNSGHLPWSATRLERTPATTVAATS